jgi:hypothetical protein
MMKSIGVRTAGKLEQTETKFWNLRRKVPKHVQTMFDETKRQNLKCDNGRQYWSAKNE